MDVIKQFAIERLDCPATYTDDGLYREAFAQAVVNGTTTIEEFDRFKDTTMQPETLFEDRNTDVRVRVKDASERYDETRYQTKSTKTGLPVVDPFTGETCAQQSQAAKARAGVLLKHLANKGGLVSNPLSEHEQGLLNDLCQSKEWAGRIGNEHYDAITGHANVKALIDDATSGGIEIAPIEFDQDVITFPLLHGELFPRVDLRSTPRGRRIEGASIATPTMSWGGADASTISLYSTSSMVNAIDTTIFAIDGAIEVGRDFLSDSPVNVGGTLTALIGERLQAELDKVIANGNGTTQPQGLFQASGVGTVSTDNGNGGPPSLNDYISLLFAIGKQYRKGNNRVAFVSNDTTYQRSRQIKVDTADPSTDQRPALTPLTKVQSYMTLELPHAVQNDLSNTVCGFAALNRYRMYRRIGMEVRWVDGGKTLALDNTMLLVYRARFGGRLMDANAMAKWTDGQS